MRYCILMLIFISVGTGCTTLALERHAVSQAATPTDIRYQEVLDNLAMVAEDRYALPTYSSIFCGTAQITDTGSLVATTTFGGPKVGMQTVNPSFTRAVAGNWTLDPINAPEKLEAIRCACRWFIYGQEFACHDCVGLLQRPDQAPYPGRHFGVYDRMLQLPQLPERWVCFGHKCDVPKNACYKGHSGETWVWVMPEYTKALADFNLILQDIARVDINSPTVQYIRPIPSDFLFPTKDRTLDPQKMERLPCFGPNCTDANVPYSPYPASVIAEVSIDPCRRLTPDILYYKWRLENYGSDANLRSQINAAGLH
jgi:hypothetical protein